MSPFTFNILKSSTYTHSNLHTLTHSLRNTIEFLEVIVNLDYKKNERIINFPEKEVYN